MPPLGGIPFGTSDISSSPGGDVTITLDGDVIGGPETGTNITIDTEIADGAVTNLKLGPEAVTIDKMAPDSVGSNQIIDHAVGFDKVQQIGADTFLGAIVDGDIQQLPMTAAGRALNAAADVAAQQTILGIKDVTDLRNYAITFFRQVFPGLVTPVEVAVEESFVNPVKAAASPNWFTAVGAGSVSVNVSGLVGGWKRLAAAAAGGATAAWVNGDTADASLGNMGAFKWLQLWYFRNTVEVADLVASAQTQLGWINTAFTVQQPLLGIQGSGSLTKFRFFDGTNGVNSDVDIDLNFHIALMWGDEAQNVFGSIDGESPKTYVTGQIGVVTPFAQVVTGSDETPEAQRVEIGHFLCLTSGNTNP